ncbi:MAG TPA: polysaccharide deacetylase family protein [Bacteroidia bacterium]|nr:polysaccharide deacetylase family protein [Bacteroidia bacterium]
MSILPKIIQRARWSLMQASFGLGIEGNWLKERPGLRILIYHGVVPAPVRRINARFVSTEQLDAHLRFIRKRCQVISVEQAFANDYDPKRLAVAVTFDDGYRNNLLHALPILQKHRIPATFFVTAARAAGQDILWADLLDVASANLDAPVTIAGNQFHKDRKGEYVDAQGQRLKNICKTQGKIFVDAMRAAFAQVGFREDSRWDDYWKLLDANELRSLSQADDIAIGGHGALHHNLDRMALPEALADVEMGIRWIEAAIGRPMHFFAFPDGGYSPELVAAVAQLGLTRLLLTEFRFGDHGDPRVRERFTVHPFLPTKVLMAEMYKGHYF